MPDNDLSAVLERMRDALQRTDTVDAKSRELLRDVMIDIRALLERSGDEPPADSLANRLREAVSEFEESHPQLTEAVGRVVDALAKMGI
jgi:hypothetical protein